MQKLITYAILVLSFKLAIGIVILLSWLQSIAFDYTYSNASGVMYNDLAHMIVLLAYLSSIRYFFSVICMTALLNSSRSIAKSWSDEDEQNSIVMKWVTSLAFKSAFVVDICGLIIDSIQPSIFINLLFLLILTPSFNRFLCEFYFSIRNKLTGK